LSAKAARLPQIHSITPANASRSILVPVQTRPSEFCRPPPARCPARLRLLWQPGE
jgi:hypothetical protein